MSRTTGPLVSVVVPTYRREEKVVRLLDSIEDSSYEPIEVIVVDDSGPDSALDDRLSDRDLTLLSTSGDRYSSYCRNYGASRASGRYLFFVDDDNVVEADAITGLVSTFEQRDFEGLLGPVTYEYRSGEVWCAGGIYRPYTGRTLHVTDLRNSGRLIECSYIPNAYMISRDVFTSIGGLDHENFPQGMEEIDLGRRLRSRGYRVAVDTDAVVRHDFPSRENRPDRPERAFHKGCTRTNFYRKHQPWRLALLPVDVGHYFLTRLRYDITFGESTSMAGQYAAGVMEALT